MFLFYLFIYFRVSPMEDTQEIEEQAHDRVISDKTSEPETRDEILSRHR